MGTLAGARATEFVLRALGETGARTLFGNKSYADTVPAMRTQLDLARAIFHVDPASSPRGIFIGTPKFTPGVDFLPLTGSGDFLFAPNADIRKKRVVFGGRLGTSSLVAPFKVEGAIVVLLPPTRGDGLPDYQVWRFSDQIMAYRSAAAVLVVNMELMPRAVQQRFREPQWHLAPPRSGGPRLVPPVIAVSRALASLLLQVPVDAGKPGYSVGIRASIAFARQRNDAKIPLSNVAGIIDGSDATLRSEYVVLTAHLDHLGVADSSARAGGDSVFNGADDGGSGSVALLAIAARLAAQPVKPKRSVVFLWTTGEEHGLLGSQWFTDRPPMSRERIVAALNVDMVGRGGGNDVPGGGPDYLQIAGARRLSTELGDWIEAVNRNPEFAFRIDGRFDAPGHPARYYCSGDHWNFARWGIPSAFVTTGTHGDYHRVTDDVSRIDFAKLERVTRFVEAIAADIANRPAPPTANQPKPDAAAACVR